MQEHATLDALVEHAEALYRDVRFGSVREWKEQEPGRKAVGFMPVWAPRQLVHAAGMMPVGVLGGGDDVEIIKGDAYFQSYICHIPRSTIEMALNGCLDVLDGMIFPSICDVIRNLSGMWKMLFDDRPAWYLDLPQSFDDTGREFFRRELGELRDGLCALAGCEPSDEALDAANRVFDENRRLVNEVYARRRETPWCHPTSEVYLVMRAGYVLPVETHNAMLRRYLDLVADADRQPMDNARVVVVGSFCEQPPLNLIRTIERAGCYVVDDDYLLGNRLIGGTVARDGDPLDALVNAFLDQVREAAFLYKPKDKGAELVARVEASHAEDALRGAFEEGGDRFGTAADDLEPLVYEAARAELDEVNSVGTGYGRSKLPFRKEQIRSEILCHGLGAHWMFPDTRTVLDFGGQDTKAIQVDESGIVTSFQMNDRCAAGCGRYLGYIADEMNLGVHELGPIAQKSSRSIKISSTCTVFAGAELRDRLTLGDKREDVLAGLHRAMMLRAMSLLARSGGVHDEFTFTGGVARNPAAVDALQSLVAEHYGERTLNISADSIYTGAVGAALFAMRSDLAAVEAA